MRNIVDLFAGAGGESTGIIRAIDGERYNLAAVNHWDIAIETHKRNHPNARHFQSDVSHLNPHDVFRPTDTVDVLWASPECTHHSVARGGRPRSEQLRASAWLILKWLSELYIRRLYIENVPEFVTWGPLGADGRPLKSRKGDTFRAFIEGLRSLGYTVDWQVLNAADYGAPTTRRRFFLQAVRGREKIRWPDPTHSQTPDLFGRRPWVPARDIIDWGIRGESILTRKRPLAEATMRRIEAGIRRFWGEWAEPFLLLLTHGGRTLPADAPIPTVTGAHRGEIGIVRPFLVPHYGERPGQDPRTHSTDKPIPTIPASGGGKFGVVEPFMVRYQGSHDGNDDGDRRTAEIDEPIGTLDTSNRYALVEPFILHQDAGGAPRSVSAPVPTIKTRNGHGLVEPFLVHYYGNGDAEPIRVPLATVTTKDRFGLVEGTYGLDITFRMLQPHELAAAQGFPRDYVFCGTKTDQVKQIGNAVCPDVAFALAREGLSA